MEEHEFNLRFNPDGECINVALDFTFYFIKGYQINRTNIDNVANYKAILKFLKENNLNFVLNTSCWSILSINFWMLYFDFSNNFVRRNKYFERKKTLRDNNTNYIILTEESARRLYGIKHEHWTHFIAYYNDLKRNLNGIYDPFKPILEKEYSWVFSDKNENYIDTKTALRILIW